MMFKKTLWFAAALWVGFTTSLIFNSLAFAGDCSCYYSGSCPDVQTTASGCNVRHFATSPSPPYTCVRYPMPAFSSLRFCGGGTSTPTPNPGGGTPTPTPNPGGGTPTPTPNPGGGTPTPTPNPGGGTPTPTPFIAPESMCPLAAPIPPMAASSASGVTNLELFKCIYDCQKPASLNCTANQKRPFDMYDKNGILMTGYYGLDGFRGPQNACLTATAASADCPVKVTSEFEAVCPNNTASCRKAASLLISYKIEQDPSITLPKGVAFRSSAFSEQPYVLSAERLFAARNNNFTCPAGMKVLGIDSYGSPSCGTDSVDAKVSCLQDMINRTCAIPTTTQCTPAYIKVCIVPTPTPTPTPTLTPTPTPTLTPTPPPPTPTPPPTPVPPTPTPGPVTPMPMCSAVVCSGSTNKYYFESATGMGAYASANSYTGTTLCGFPTISDAQYVACGMYTPPSSPTTSPPQPGYQQCGPPSSRPISSYYGVVGANPCQIP